MSSIELGWYNIDEVWNLYVDGNLQKVHVDFVCVDEQPSGEDYVVQHYNQAGKMITSNTLTEDDILPELQDRDTVDRPLHI